MSQQPPVSPPNVHEDKSEPSVESAPATAAAPPGLLTLSAPGQDFLHQFVHTLIPKAKLIGRGTPLAKLPLLDRKKGTLPASADLSSKVPSVLSQLSLGACTAFSICQAYRMLQKNRDFTPSCLYVYYKERQMESGGRAITDSGANAWDGLTWIANHGVCPESDWPYNVSKVNVAPPASCDTSAAPHKLSGAYDVVAGGRTATAIRSNIMTTVAAGLPVLLAFGVYRSFFNTGSNGLVPMPNPGSSSDPLMGGHEITLLGYDTATQLYHAVNSWGSGWGKGGYCYMPFAMVENTTVMWALSTFTTVIEPVGPTPTPTPGPTPAPTPSPDSGSVNFSSGFAGATNTLQLNGDALVANVSFLAGPTDSVPEATTTTSRMTPQVGTDSNVSVANALVLTRSTNQRSSAFTKTALLINKFTTSFVFQLLHAAGNGFTFCVQTTGSTALGSGGAGLGYQGIARSLAVKFGILNENSIGIVINGSAPSSSSVNIANIQLKAGNPIQASITYDGKTLSIALTDTVTKGTFNAHATLTMIGTTGYVGFTAATSASALAWQLINTWTFTPYS